MRTKMRLARLAILPCAGEVKRIAACIPSEEGAAPACDDDHLREMAELTQPPQEGSYCRREGSWTVCD